MTRPIVRDHPPTTQAPARLPLERRREAFGCIQDQFAIRYLQLRHVSDPDARAGRQRELAEQIARFRAQLLPESLVTVIGVPE